MAAPQVLVVEDNEMQSTLVSFLLQEDGYTVQTAETAEAALEVLRRFSPDLILLDLQLPGMDGLELARTLRLDPVHRATPIIALTAYTDPTDLERARQAGCNGKISKPIQTATFARQVEKFMSPTADARADELGDSSDLLADIRNSFLAEGLEQCGTFLKDLKSDPGGAIEVVQRVLHRWAGLAGTLGFPEISEQAQKIDVLLTSANTEYAEIRKALENARRRFSIAAHNRPRLPVELVAGLSTVRIGLVNVSEEEANRIESTAKREGIQVAIEQVKNASLETQAAYSALIVDECRGSAQSSLARQDLSIPAVFIRSRSSLESLFQLQSRAFDFVIAPWDAEEILVRVYRLVMQAGTPHQPAPWRQLKSRPRVLIADDDPDIVCLVEKVLRGSEMDCEIAHSGHEALDAVHRHAPDAIVLDINMADLDGFEVLKRLRRNLVTTEIPVLLLSARRQGTDIVKGLGCGADDYLVKPFEPSELAQRVSKIISSRHKPRIPHSAA